jgi:putative lipoic acid-binding regulatory protein
MDQAHWDKLKNNLHFEELLDFPCSFSIKVVCRTGGWVRQAVEEALVAVSPDPEPQFVDQRFSSGRRYVSCTIRLEVESARHLRECYGALGELDCVRLAI